jgi:hypothetical protein
LRASVQEEQSSSSSDVTNVGVVHHNDAVLTQELICKLRFRELKQELEARNLSVEGTTSQLRDRLRQSVLPDGEDECFVNKDDMGDDCVSTVSSTE